MKKALIFIGLKVVEILGIVFVPYYSSKWIFVDLLKTSWIEDAGDMLLCWVAGLWFLGVIGFIIYPAARFVVRKNLKWSDKIIERIKR